LYGDGMQVRDWLHVDDHCEGIWTAFTKGKAGEVYNIGGGQEHPNIAVARLVLRELGKPEKLISFVKDRPGHDRRYSVDCAKLRGLGWAPRQGFEEAMGSTVRWYVANEAWWKPLLSP
ncbi:MAG: GDP-mannose 4,6-dehydratase, partial [Halobacteriales archaeon]|nr:GDP-mannose 4,6-dehydratase [Halobacteriales archaeon]